MNQGGIIIVFRKLFYFVFKHKDYIESKKLMYILSETKPKQKRYKIREFICAYIWFIEESQRFMCPPHSRIKIFIRSLFKAIPFAIEIIKKLSRS